MEDDVSKKLKEIYEIANEYNCCVNKNINIEKISEQFIKFGNKCLCNRNKPCPCDQINYLSDTCKCGLFTIKEN